jgi:hypothetical protein
MYKIQVGDFQDFLPEQTLPGMKLLHYFPIYMHDTDTAIIPDLIRTQHQNPLALTTSLLDRTWHHRNQMLEQNILKTLNPNTEQRHLTFSMKGESIPEDLPFLDRSVFFRFDLISAQNNVHSIEKTFELFEINLINKSTIEFVIIHVDCIVSLTRKIISDAISFEGNIKLEISKNDSSSPSKKKVGLSHPISINSIHPDAINNFFTGEYFKTKYKNANFFNLMKPQGLLINVVFLLR